MSPQNARTDAPAKAPGAIAAAIADAQSGLVPGAKLDRYELLSPLAQGGMASVWLARLQGKHGFQKLVALKTIRHEFAADLTFQQMFLDEARIASGITHPNVAQIFDLGEHDGLLYLAMEWVDGDSLSKIQKTVQRAGHYFPVPFAVSIMADICNGLHAAHELKDDAGRVLEVVHRDVSPSNVLVTREGIPKVIDFGIAKALGRVAEETSAGMLKGKIFYMAPEQAMGRAVDRRADVWAVGATLHTLLSGAPPFPGENEVAVLHKLMTGAAPTPLPAHVPPAIGEVLARSMSHDVLQRTADCRTLGYELRQAMRASGMEVDPAALASFFDNMLGDSARERQSLVQHALSDAAGRQGNPAHDPSSSGVSRRQEPVAANGQMSSRPAPAIPSGIPPEDDPTRSDPRFARLAGMGGAAEVTAIAEPLAPFVALGSVPSLPSMPLTASLPVPAPVTGVTAPSLSLEDPQKSKWTLLHTLVTGLAIIAVLATAVVLVMTRMQRAETAPPAATTSAPKALEPAAPPASLPELPATATATARIAPEPPATAAATVAPAGIEIDPAPDKPAASTAAPGEPKPVTTSHAATPSTPSPKPAKPKPAGNPDFGF